MGAVSALTRGLRLDLDTWRWLESEAKWWSSVAIAFGSYLLLAFSRFGWPDFAIRATTRFLLTGLYGWVWLAGASWVIIRLRYGVRGSAASLLRLTGHAHLPLLLVAILIQIVAVSLDIPNVAGWPALFVGVFWMPAMLVSAVAAGSDLDSRRAAPSVVLSYIAWAAVVGTYFWGQLGHLL